MFNNMKNANTKTGDIMKRNTVITILLIFLGLLCTLAGTYAVIIEVTDNDGIKEIINTINTRDLFTDINGNYNNLYYDVKRELDITEEEANILIDSSYVNDSLQIVLESIVDYRMNNINDAKLSNDDIIRLIEDSVNNTKGLSDSTKTKIINKSKIYKNDISDYLYNIEISVIGN